jgi:hypothetical protein
MTPGEWPQGRPLGWSTRTGRNLIEWSTSVVELQRKAEMATAAGYEDLAREALARHVTLVAHIPLLVPWLGRLRMGGGTFAPGGRLPGIGVWKLWSALRSHP